MRVTLSMPGTISGWIWLHKPKGWTIASHCHDEVEFNLVIAGTATYVVGDQRYELAANDGMWLFSDQDHVLTEMSLDFEMWILVIHPDLLRRHCQTGKWAPMLAGDPPGNWCRSLSADGVQHIRQLCELFTLAGGDDVLATQALVHASLAAWDYFDRAGAAAGPQVLHPAVAKAVASLVAEDWLELDGLAAHCGLSYSRLSRLFKKAVGETLVGFRNRCRLQRFLDQASVFDEQTIAARALDAGFGSYAQFHRVCVEQLGCGPRDWLHQRQQLTEGVNDESA